VGDSLGIVTVNGILKNLGVISRIIQKWDYFKDMKKKVFLEAVCDRLI
jgi:hypothetical protein